MVLQREHLLIFAPELYSQSFCKIIILNMTTTRIKFKKRFKSQCDQYQLELINSP